MKFKGYDRENEGSNINENPKVRFKVNKKPKRQKRFTKTKKSTFKKIKKELKKIEINVNKPIYYK